MDDFHIRKLITALDCDNWSDAEDAREKLIPLGPAILPFFLEAYPELKIYRGRSSIVYTSIKFARDFDDAVLLGIIALSDKSTIVRHNACTLLAFSLERTAIPHLKKLLNHHDKKTSDDALAAIDAIEHQNHNYFIDRSHSGTTFLNVGGYPSKMKISSK